MQISSCLTAWAFAALSLVAHAAGNHAGGHGHDTSAIGQAGRPADVSRTLQVEMRDTMRFNPSSFSVQQGETIRFVVSNTGKLKHEFVLGTAHDLREHNEVMKKFPDMEHAEDNMLTLAPGKAGELIWKFTRAGTVHVGCLSPGHYDAGMKATIRVTPRAATKNP